MGCISCILMPTASSSTMGVDFAPPYPFCAGHEPLYAPRDPQVNMYHDTTRLPQKEAFLENHEKQQYIPMSSLASSGMFDIQEEPETEIEMTSRLSDTGADLVKESNTVEMEEDEKVPKIQQDAAAVVSVNAIGKSQLSEDDDGDAEVDEAAIQHALVAAATWVSDGTGGCRAMYSRVRSHAEVQHHRRASYFELQRPDLDRRISHQSSLHRSSLQETQTGKPIRHTSALFRSR